MSKYARKVDTNQADVIQWYEGLGYSIINTSAVGNGFPDLIAVKKGVRLTGIEDHAGWGWQTIFIEVKRSKYAKYTQAQKDFNEKYPGLAVRVETFEDVKRSVQDDN